MATAAAVAAVSPRSINDLVPFTSLKIVDDEPIGFGAFGAVYKALHSQWGCLVAYKKLAVSYIGKRSKADQQLIQSLKYEAEIHRQLRHPNIVSMLGVVFEESNYGIILEFVTYGSWMDFLNNIRHESEISCVPYILKIKLSHEISSGMSYLHGLNIIHCDLKLQNVLITEHINAKLSDFGLSKWKDYSRSHTNTGMTRGTPSHISPEQWKDMNHLPCEKSDVYSFSIVLWEMFTEKQAYEGRGAIITGFVLNGGRLSLDRISRDVPKEMHSLIEVCWNQEADKRPNFREVTSRLSPFVNGAIKERELKNAKEVVLRTYYRPSNFLAASDVENFDHSQKIKRVHQTLCEFIRYPDEILSSLFEKGAVTDEEHTTLLRKTNIFKWARYLLEVLSVKPAAAYQHFLDALDASNQHHLHLLLEDKDYKLNVDHKVTLIDNFTYLKDNITLSDAALLDALLELNVLDQREVTEIKSKNTDHERTDQLLQCILRTSQKQYQQFLEVLNKTGHRHVYFRLTGVEVVSTTEVLVAQENIGLIRFLSNSSVLKVIPSSGRDVCGITVLSGEVFVVRSMAQQVSVYNSINFALSRSITLPRSKGLHAIVSCSHNNCLYLTDVILEVVYRYDLANEATINWSLCEPSRGLSTTKHHHVLVTLSDTCRIQEYTTNGNLIREIRLDEDINDPWHSAELSTGNFVVCYRYCVSIIDPVGRIIHSYYPTDDLPRYSPRHLAVDVHDNVLVADYGYNKVQLFSPRLTCLGHIDIPGYELNGPETLHFDELNHRLYIGESEICDDGRVFVLHSNYTAQ